MPNKSYLSVLIVLGFKNLGLPVWHFSGIILEFGIKFSRLAVTLNFGIRFGITLAVKNDFYLS